MAVGLSIMLPPVLACPSFGWLLSARCEGQEEGRVRWEGERFGRVCVYVYAPARVRVSAYRGLSGKSLPVDPLNLRVAERSRPGSGSLQSFLSTNDTPTRGLSAGLEFTPPICEA